MTPNIKYLGIIVVFFCLIESIYSSIEVEKRNYITRRRQFNTGSVGPVESGYEFSMHCDTYTCTCYRK